MRFFPYFLFIWGFGWTTEPVPLSVLLYPWVPDYQHIAAVVESEFEAAHPEVDLVLAPPNRDYYKPGGLDKRYDVYELDTAYLPEFVQKKRLQALDAEKMAFVKTTALPVALSASTWGAKLYGVPHWTCALFLFYLRDDAPIADAHNFPDLQAAIGREHRRGEGLLVDMKGKATLTELYIDALLDLGFSPPEVAASLERKTLEKKAVSRLEEVLGLSALGDARSEAHHDAWPPWHAVAFARGQGRAVVGYSERMFHILNALEGMRGVGALSGRSIGVKVFNQGNATAKPLSWVDSFVVDATVSDEKLEAAYAFLQFMASDELYLKCLLPQEGKPPLYLLPAYESTFKRKELLAVAPMYRVFFKGVQQASTVRIPHFSEISQKIGTLLDQRLLSP